jgi:MoaA/NifB/PqqE/SkfB family radical SAM enzyme
VDDLSREDIFRLLEEAKEAGMIGYTVWGGEPLLRDDLPEILRFAKKKKFATMLITNGLLLEARCREITPSTDFLFVSIDSNSSLHDEMRGVEGMLRNAIDGIKSCRREKTRIAINSVISNLNLGEIEGLFELSRELDVAIAFEPMEVFDYNEQFKATDEELRVAFSKILEYKRSGYRVANSAQYLQNFSRQKQYVCHAPKCYITADAHGNLISCSDKSWGSIKEKSLEEIFASMEFRDVCRRAEKCTKCNVSCVIESSLAYSLSPFFVLDKVRNLF